MFPRVGVRFLGNEPPAELTVRFWNLWLDSPRLHLGMLVPRDTVRNDWNGVRTGIGHTERVVPDVHVRGSTAMEHRLGQAARVLARSRLTATSAVADRRTGRRPPVAGRADGNTPNHSACCSGAWLRLVSVSSASTSLWFCIALLYNYNMGRQPKDARAIHNRLAVLRAERSLSRQQLADAIGVNFQTIGYLERGDYSPSLELAFRLSEYFDLPIEAIFARAPFAPMTRQALVREET